MEGKHLVVTGATQGVGAAVALLAAQRGARAMTITGRNPAQGEAMVAKLKDHGTEALFVAADLAGVKDCFAVIDRALETFGPIDSLVNCAGKTDRGTIDDTSEELFDSLFAVNVRAPFFLCQRAMPSLRAQHGTVVNIISIAAHGGQPFISAYCASKGALATLTRNMAGALRWDRVRINGLNIGWTDSPGENNIQRTYHNQSADWLAKSEAKQPFGRLIKPDEIARAVMFLASEESGLMTGAVIDFDQTILGTIDDNPR
ncbi:MAG: SDR family oxidoreductase [Pseudomonadota bacterium]